MPLERHATYNPCSSSLDENQLRSTGLFRGNTLRQQASEGTQRFHLLVTFSSLDLEHHESGSVGRHNVPAPVTRSARIEPPSRPMGVSVRDWRVMVDSMGSCEDPHVRLMKRHSMH
jgi:hypothetical protein